MSPGAIIATGFWGLFTALVVYGVVYDWLRQRPERRAGMWLAAMDDVDRIGVERRRRVPQPDPLIDPLELLYELPCAPDPKVRG